MVQHMLELSPELQALIMAQLVDATTAGRLGQASRTCRLLVQQRLKELCEAQRLAMQTQMEVQRQQKRDALLQLFEPTNGGNTYRCRAHTVAFGTPCGKQLCVPRSGSLQVLWHHLKVYHPAEFGALKITLGQM